MNAMHTNVTLSVVAVGKTPLVTLEITRTRLWLIGLEEEDRRTRERKNNKH
jgi:hypothetical protein